jgi:hypothetical protein
MRFLNPCLVSAHGRSLLYGRHNLLRGSLVNHVSRSGNGMKPTVLNLPVQLGRLVGNVDQAVSVAGNCLSALFARRRLITAGLSLALTNYHNQS